METIYVLTDQKKREQERLDDATFYEFLAEYLDALLVDSRNFESEEKKALANIERDSAAFASREKEHVQKIKDLEGGIFELSKEMLVCRKMLELDKVKQKKLKESRLELLQLMASEEETFSEKVEKLELELKCVEKERVNYEVQTNIVLKDLDIVKTENKKLRAHIRKFQEDISEIVGQ
ncbi:unnamed protein product [Amoebophrya sp. A25]|nr:unnamed protein product [Amoebophrya sp. A25]|eukprot:GSA25T00015034001.1